MSQPESTRQHVAWSAVWGLIKPYWSSEKKWQARGLLCAIVVLAMGMIYLNVQFTNWNLAFYNALQNKDFAEFKSQLWRFSYLAFIFIFVAIYRVYLEQALEMQWRAWLTDKYLDRWLANQSYYRIEQTQSADNPDQRIAEDLRALTRGTLHLGIGGLSAAVTFVTFVGILWSVSGPLSFMLAGSEWTLHGYMVWFAIAYAGMGSVLVWWIGKALVRQNVEQQKYEANFRFGLVRIRENAEPIALYRGESQEHVQSASHFERIRQNWWAIMRTTKRMNIAALSYQQFANIFPFLVASPRYFSGAIQLGGLMQISSAFGELQDSLSWFIKAFSETNGESIPVWKASVNRLAGFHQAVTAANSQAEGIQVNRNNVGAILLDHLVLKTPAGHALTTPLTADVRFGQSIVVSGPSGCGKSTLFRALAGIWPYGAGSIEIPMHAELMFVPQKSYLPITSLRAAVSYPAGEQAYRDLAIQHYLALCRLEHLKGSLDEFDNWSQRLSPGEQQRLAFVRVLLARPDILFLDEATSALDGRTEEALYVLVQQELPQLTLVSIAHREAVAKFHQIRWQFIAVGEAGNTMEAEGEDRGSFTIESRTITNTGSAAKA